MGLHTLGTAPPGYLESASTNDEPDDDKTDARFDVSEPKKRKFGGVSPSFSLPSSARRYNTINPQPAGERGKECGSPELCTPRPSAAMMLSSAEAWAVEFPLGKKADVGWREPRDAGLDGEIGTLEEEDAL